MRYLASVFLPLAFVASCASAPPLSPQNARNALAVADRGLSDVAPVIDALCAAQASKCAALRADQKAAQSAMGLLRDALDAGGELQSASDKLGAALRRLILDLQMAKAAQGS